jgi:cytoskeletal protein RodZ
MSEPTGEQPTVDPTVTTDPGRSRWHWSAVPSHLGRARTSTVVLALLFLAIGALYLNIRPETPPPATAGTPANVEQPATPTTEPEATTTAPETTTPETTTEPPVGPTTSEPTDTAVPTDTSEPTETTEPTPTLPTPTPRNAPSTSPSSPTP